MRSKANRKLYQMGLAHLGIVSFFVAAFFFYLYAKDLPPIDDAGITFRYAKNIAEGKGFCYNYGEEIIGTSTPLYTLLLAFLGYLGFDIPTSSFFIGLLSGIFCCAIVFWFTKELSSICFGLLAGWLLFMRREFIFITISGMETSFYSLLILLSFVAYARRKYIWSTVFASLCVLARLDGAVVGLALFLAYLYEHRRPPWRYLLLYVVLISPWFFYAYSHFGSIFPLSLIAKQNRPHKSFWVLKYFLRKQWIVYFPFIFAAILYLFKDRMRFNKCLPVLIWLLIYLLAYALAELQPRGWYIAPIWPALFILIPLGTKRICEFLSKVAFPRFFYSLIVSMVLILLIGVTLISSSKKIKRYKLYVNSVEEDRIQIGKWLRENTDPQATVATGAIGHIGYYSQRYIIDFAGLITPYAVRAPGYTKTINFFRPDYVVRCDGWPWRGNKCCEDPEFLRDYTLIKEYHKTELFYGTYYIFKRKAGSRNRVKDL